MVEIRGDHWSFWRGEGLGCVFFLSLLKKNVIKSWYLCVLRSAICLGLQKSSFFYFFMNQWLYTQQGQVTSFLTKSVATKLSFVILSFNERDSSSISALCIAWLNTNVFKSNCKTRGHWFHSLLNLSALSTVSLLLDPEPETLILLTENLVWPPLSSVLHLYKFFSASCSVASVLFKFFLPFPKSWPLWYSCWESHSWRRKQNAVACAWLQGSCLHKWKVASEFVYCRFDDPQRLRNKTFYSTAYSFL